MELRDIEIFLTLAEELHFGRTAARLHVSPGRISQVIKKQERSVGAHLFERTSRAVRLTPLGEQLRDDLRPHYQGLLQSLVRARLAAQGKTEMLRVGMISTNAYELRPYWDEFRARHPACGLTIRHNAFIDPFVPLRNGDIDVLVAWLPVEEPDLTAGPVVFSEPKVLLVSSDHELAERISVPPEVRGDFAGATAVPSLPEYWEDSFHPFYTPTGRMVEKSLFVRSVEDILVAVGSGEVIQNLGAHASRHFARPGIVFLPIEDSALLRWALVWRSDRENRWIRGLADIARDLGTIEM
ncbi:LysR family transcriptional regulator [Nocardia sp. NPDC051570]|uniref:LysR family transcriptional regulator n=1 Tax=Nocardia sp. NPDC051570 TaxID=3364324 RepID=UPI0037915250